jgi:hypothetical protein
LQKGWNNPGLLLFKISQGLFSLKLKDELEFTGVFVNIKKTGKIVTIW